MFTKEISFNEVPEAMAHLIVKVEKIESLLEAERPEPKPEDRWFNVRELCLYHPDKPAKTTIYSWVRDRLLPYHKHGKKLLFLKSEVDAWLKAGRQQTRGEISTEAKRYVQTKLRFKN
jgi:excisionase family DNA binding protein